MKGQAAIEYLMTYGWALLALTILLALLLTSGIFSPSYLVSEECNLGPNLPCKFILYEEKGDMKIAMNITNGFGYRIKLTSISLTSTDDRKTFDITLPDQPSGIVSGGSIFVQGIRPGYTAAQSTVKKMVAGIKYYSCADEVNPTCGTPAPGSEHTITGRVIGRVT
jgi:hypothetical protein